MRNFKVDKSERVLSCLRFLSGTISHLFAILFVVYMIYISAPGSSLFSWHPVLMSLGCGLFMLEAILVFSPENSFFVSSSRSNKVRVHWIFQSLAIALTWIGFIVILVNKSLYNKKHFKSWHGLFGLITVLYVTLQALFGILLLFPKFAKQWNWKLVQLKVYHATFGLVGFILSSVTMILSLYSNFIKRNVDEFFWWFCLIAIVWWTLFVINQVSNTYSRYMSRTTVPL